MKKGMMKSLVKEQAKTTQTTGESRMPHPKHVKNQSPPAKLNLHACFI